MNYVMSDLHGCYDEFLNMLELINFSEEDSLFIIGDVVDRGDASVKLLQDLMIRPNLRLLMGNHDFIMSKVLNALPVDIKINKFKDYFHGELLFDYEFWMNNGGSSTLYEYLHISVDERTEILKFLNSLSYYYELTVESQKYILVHSIPRGFKKDTPIENYVPEDLLFSRIRNDKWDEYFYDDKMLIVGHTPTFFIDRTYEGKIYKRKKIINVDCGCVYKDRGGRLGCLRLEDMREYYI